MVWIDFFEIILFGSIVSEMEFLRHVFCSYPDWKYCVPIWCLDEPSDDEELFAEHPILCCTDVLKLMLWQLCGFIMVLIIAVVLLATSPLWAGFLCICTLVAFAYNLHHVHNSDDINTLLAEV